MKKQRPKRPSAALIISCLALFIALGGTVYASSKISGSTVKKNSLPGNRVKKNSLTGNRLKKNTLTGNQINESKLGVVPNATNASNVESVRTFSVGANEGQLVSLVKTSNFELMGFCDPKETAFPPGIEGTEAERKGTTLVIYNRSSTLAFAQSSDADNYRLELNQGIGFNYQDNGDGGMAMSTDGHFLSTPDYGNLVADTSYENEPSLGDNYPFSTSCHFAGTALVG